ncbi:MAG TPA: hypothetical protein VIU38_01645 [Anaerolineales bacterium]
MPLDITITPLYRAGGKDQTSLPGLMAAVPPRQAARGRDQDRLIVYLQLAGKAVLSSGDVVQSASRAAMAFYATPGTITSALRAAAATINKQLHERNLAGSGEGKHAVAFLALAAVRESQLTLLLSGPMQAFVLGSAGVRHIADSLSGRGLGLGNSAPHYFSQTVLQAGDRIVICSALPAAWESALRDSGPVPIDAMRRRLMLATSEDVNAVLMQAGPGEGALHLQRVQVGPRSAAPSEIAYASDEAPESASGVAEPTQSANIEESPANGSAAAFADAGAGSEATSAPSAYAIPRERKSDVPSESAQLEPEPTPAVLGGVPETAGLPLQTRTLIPPERQRQLARKVVAASRTLRQAASRVGAGLRIFLPRLLPVSEQNPWSMATPAMTFIAILVPVVVVTIASSVYFRYGRSVQYEQYLVQVQDARAQAITLTDPVAEREAWQRELFYLDKAEEYTETAETKGLRIEAQQKLDQVLGIQRLQFQPALSRGVGAQIGRLAAGENDVYLLDAQRGAVIHLALTNAGFQIDSAFNCGPGTYGPYTVGPLIDILALPVLNTLNASIVGVDALGTLLYCAPGQVAQAVPLPVPDTNWGRIRSFALDSGNLYVLDAQSRAVWVYVGADGAFVDRPYFFFGGQIPELADAIDMAVSADDLYVLHSDGRLSTCSYSRIQSVPTRCVDPAPLSNPLGAYRDQDLFSQAHFTQMMFSPPPDASLLLLDADGQGVFRFSARTLELQSHMRPLAGKSNAMPAGEVTAMGISPNHILYFALRDRIYFAADAP